MRPIASLHFLSILYLPTLSIGQQKCFDSRGIQNTNVPCDPSASAGPCCAETFICLSNGLCQPGPGTRAAKFQTITEFYQGSCTDPTWEDPRCPRFCLSAEDSASGQGLNACSGAGVGKFCCWRSNGDCCKNSSAIFNLGIANIQTTIGVVGKTSSMSSSMAMSSSLASASTSSIQSSLSTSSSPTSSPNTGQSRSPSNSTTIGVGVGVGVAVALLLAGAGIFFYSKLKRKRATKVPNKEVPVNTELDGSEVATYEIGAGTQKPRVYELR